MLSLLQVQAAYACDDETPAFSALRVFTLSKSWTLSTLVFILSIVPLGVNLVLPFTLKHETRWFTSILQEDRIAHDFTGIVDPIAGCVATEPGITLQDVVR